MAGIKSFRISDETKERLELLSASIGGNKDRVFNTLMDTYSLEQEKATVAASDQEKNSGLYGLGIVYVYRVLRTDNMFDTKPVRQPDNRTQVPRVLNIIQCQAKRLACELRT